MPPTKKNVADTKGLKKGNCKSKVENQLSEILFNRTLKIKLHPKSVASVERRNISGLEFTTTEDECILHGILPIISDDLEDVESTENIVEPELLEIKDCYVKLHRSIECEKQSTVNEVNIVNEVEVTKEKATLVTISQCDSIGNKHHCKICSEYFEDNLASKFHDVVFHKEKDDLIQNQKIYLDEIRQLALASLTGETVESVENKLCSPCETEKEKGEEPPSATNTHIDKKRTCVICYKTFSCSSALYRHERRAHFKERSGFTRRKRSNPTNPKRTDTDTSKKHPLKDLQEAQYSNRTKETTSKRMKRAIIVAPSIIGNRLKSALNHNNKRSERSRDSLIQTTAKPRKSLQECQNSIKQKDEVLLPFAVEEKQ